MRMLLTGSRNWQDQEAVWSALDALACRGEPVTVAHGDCPQGADALASAGVKPRHRRGRTLPWLMDEVPLYLRAMALVRAVAPFGSLATDRFER